MDSGRAGQPWPQHHAGRGRLDPNSGRCLDGVVLGAGRWVDRGGTGQKPAVFAGGDAALLDRTRSLLPYRAARGLLLQSRIHDDPVGRRMGRQPAWFGDLSAYRAGDRMGPDGLHLRRRRGSRERLAQGPRRFATQHSKGRSRRMGRRFRWRRGLRRHRGQRQRTIFAAVRIVRARVGGRTANRAGAGADQERVAQCRGRAAARAQLQYRSRGGNGRARRRKRGWTFRRSRSAAAPCGDRASWQQPTC